MAMNNLGRVAMVHRGDYDPLYEYKPLDCCYHQGSTYLCKAETVGNAPPNAAYWVLMSTSASTVDREAAEAAALEAQGYKDQAAAQVGLAADQVALAAGHVDAAAGHVTAAQGKVDLAAAQVDLAEQHAVAAGTSETGAAQSAAEALESKNAAKVSEDNAAASATAAQQAAASVDGPGLLEAIRTHPHDGTTDGGVKIHYSNLDDRPALTAYNILHNWDFRNPVNQRGVTGAISTGTYFYDRWIRNSGTVTVNAGYLTLASGSVIEQRIEGNLLAGVLCTVSFEVDSTIYTGTGVFPVTNGTVLVEVDGYPDITFGCATGYMFVLVPATSNTSIKRFKCEMGTVSTLHLDPPMDYASEYNKSLRFLAPLSTLMTMAGISTSTTTVQFFLPLGQYMRANPTLVGVSEFTVVTDATSHKLTPSTMYRSPAGVLLTGTTTGLTAWKPCTVWPNGNGFLTAEL